MQNVAARETCSGQKPVGLAAFTPERRPSVAIRRPAAVDIVLRPGAGPISGPYPPCGAGSGDGGEGSDANLAGSGEDGGT